MLTKHALRPRPPSSTPTRRNAHVSWFNIRVKALTEFSLATVYQIRSGGIIGPHRTRKLWSWGCDCRPSSGIKISRSTLTKEVHNARSATHGRSDIYKTEETSCAWLADRQKAAIILRSTLVPRPCVEGRKASNDSPHQGWSEMPYKHQLPSRKGQHRA